jgi:hypothetical protein
MDCKLICFCVLLSSVSGALEHSAHLRHAALNMWTRKPRPPPSSPLQWPEARGGHTAVLFKNRMIVFGGMSRDSQYLNDVWEYNLGSPHPLFPSQSQEDELWSQVFYTESFADWYNKKDTSIVTRIRRGVVPARPSGRIGHSVSVSRTLRENGDSADVMVLFGGLSPNCSDFCADLWYYDLSTPPPHPAYAAIQPLLVAHLRRVVVAAAALDRNVRLFVFQTGRAAAQVAARCGAVWGVCVRHGGARQRRRDGVLRLRMQARVGGVRV